MGPYCDDLVNEFEFLAENLAPDKEYIKEAKKAAQRIFKQLHQGRYSLDLRIARTIIAGSIGKGTGISYLLDYDEGTIYPDLDLVVYVNDEQPPFRELYEDFEELLLELGDVTDVRFTKCSIQFKIGTPSFGDINVDLLAAENLVKNTNQWSSTGIYVGEVEAMIASMNLDRKQKNSIKLTRTVNQVENRLSSSAFAEKTVKTIKDIVKDEFILDEVFLAKFWASRIDLEEYRYMPARSCMIEVIAIKAQQTKRKRNGEERCIVSGFRRFLEAMSKLRTLDISLKNCSKEIGLKNYTKPMIRDPANKWNNLADGIHPGAIRMLEQQAKKTLKLLQHMRNKNGYYEYENPMEMLFAHKY